MRRLLRALPARSIALPMILSTLCSLTALALLARRLGVVAVAGDSMQPTLRPGDACLVRYGARIHPGDVVVARLPARPLGVKRAEFHDADGWWLSSDDPRRGTDSATFGSVVDDDVLGRVLLRYWPDPAWLGSSRSNSSSASRS